MTEWLLLGGAVILIALNALFVAAEFALVTVDRATVEREADAGDRRAQSVLRALRSLSMQLSGAQLGITVTSLVVGWLAEPSLATLLRRVFGLTDLPGAVVTTLSIGLALVIATGTQMVFGELVPKNWAIAEPLRVGRAVAGPQRAFTTASGLLIRLLNGSANRILRLMGIEPREELASARSPHELTSLVHRSVHEGTLDETTGQLVTRSISFGDHSARDVMTPRPRVQFVRADWPAQRVLELAAGTGHARFPVTRDGVDDIVGAVHFKHALAVDPDDRASRPVSSVMVPATIAPETIELDPLLAHLREPGLQMAVVVDEFGGTAGIVTLEDLVEEIVGEISDEQDRPSLRHYRFPDGSWALSGLLRLDEVADYVGLILPESEESESLGGLVVEQLGRLPDVGDAVTVAAQPLNIPAAGTPWEAVQVELTVVRLDGLRVDRVRLRVLDSDSTTKPAGEESDDA